MKDEFKKILDGLSNSNKLLSSTYKGDSPDRQPVHTLYGGAQLFKFDTTKKIGNLALKAFKEYAPNFVVFAKALDIPGSHTLPNSKEEQEKLILKENKNYHEKLAFDIYNKVEKKLINEAVEDFRIDFEDGFGNRSDEEEDNTAVFAAQQVAKGMREKTLPPFIGIRIKSFSEDLKYRGARTLDLFLNTLLKESFGQIPENFVITLPKVTIAEQVEAFVSILELIETENNLQIGTFKIEIMIETTQALFNQKGEANLLNLYKAARGRCRGAHFGTYDYTASCDITAKYQIMDHDACNFARHMMKVCLAGTGVWLSDGATNVMPVGPHKGELSKEQLDENMKVVHNAWKLAYDHTMHSLKNGFYQGWDLHPSQLCVRYGAVYTFFLESLDQASARLKNFIEKAAQATLVGDIFDDAATGQGLLNYFLRALNCGAISVDDITSLTGLTIDEIRMKSFLKILENRKLR
jgi:citrate lyase beta subunit